MPEAKIKLKDQIGIVSKIKNEISKKNAKLLNLYISGAHLYGFDDLGVTDDTLKDEAMGTSTI